MRIAGGCFFVDRPLTRWEWVKVRVFHRRDPRLLGHITQTGGTVEVWLDEGVFRTKRDA